MSILSKEIIKEWNLASLPEQKQKEMVDRVGRVLYQAILVRTLDILSENDGAELDLLLDKDSTRAEDVLVFLKGKIPKFDKVVAEERKNIKEHLLVSVS